MTRKLSVERDVNFVLFVWGVPHLADGGGGTPSQV